MPARSRTTRLAPSPTGALHLGNARTFLVNWAMARRSGWRIVLRIEDLDGPRIKPGADRQVIEDLHWLGVDWDPCPLTGGHPLYQRQDLSPYHKALEALAQRGLIYPCHCTRRGIEQAQSAPHADDHELRYPGTCRPTGAFRVSRSVFRVGEQSSDSDTDTITDASRAEPGTSNAKRETAWRVIVPDEPISFDDQIHGPQSINVQYQVGDFIVATKAGLPAYQLAVVVDDARQGVTEVVRGDDLLASTARQVLLYRMLGVVGIPRYWHLPLVLGPDGRRLAKRHGDTRIAWYRGQGVPAQRIIGLLAFWCGVVDDRRSLDASEFRERFDLARLPRTAVTFTPEDHAWLRTER